MLVICLTIDMASFPFAFNVDEALALLNGELEILGIPAIPANSEDLRRRLLDIAFRLVDLQRKNVSAINDLETEKRVLVGDKEQTAKSLRLSREKCVVLKRSLAEREEKERRLEEKMASLQKTLNREVEERKKMAQAAQYKEKLFLHESRKNERELERLKEHIQQMDKSAENFSSAKMDCSQSLRKPGGRRSTWSNLASTLTKEEEMMYSVVVTNYGERQKQLLAENSHLRRSLLLQRSRLDDLFDSLTPESSLSFQPSTKDGHSGRISRLEGEYSDGDIDDDPRLRLPLELLNFADFDERLERAERICSRRKERDSRADDDETLEDREKPPPSKGNDVSDSTKALMEKIRYYEGVIERQAQMVERLKSSTKDSNGELVLQRERDALSAEKKKVAEEALCLAKERLKIREERCRLMAGSSIAETAVAPGAAASSVSQTQR